MTSHKPTNGTTADSDSSIIIDHRFSRSIPTAALQTLLRPFKSRLFTISVHAAGSGVLTPPSSVHAHCNVHERIVKDVRIYDINARSHSTRQYVAYTEEVRAQSKEEALLGSRSRPQDSTRQPRQAFQTPAVPPLPSSEPQQQYHPLPQDNGTPISPTSPPATDAPSDQSHLNTLVNNDTPLATSSPHPQTANSENLAPSHTNTTLSTVPTRDANNAHLNLDLVRTKTRDFAHTATTTRPRPRQIYYFAGGGWQMPPTKDHWKMCAHFATTMTKNGTPTTVSLVSSPLAPHSPAGITMPMLERMYYELFTPVALMVGDPKNSEHYLPQDVQMPEIIFAGDSSGGNIALALTLHVLTKDKNAPAPDSLLLISPSVQMPTTNPLIRSIQKHDPVLSLRAIQQTHAAWPAASTGSSPRVCNALDLTDPLVSPMFGDLAEFKRRNVRVNGVNAGYDVLGADVRDFLGKLKRVGVQGTWLEWDRMMHVFPLTFAYGIKEGKKGVEWIIETIEAERRR